MSFYFNSSSGNYNIQDSGNKFNGRSIRCVFVSTAMQDFTSTTCANLEVAKTITLTDIRDMKTYNIAKLDDNICRMTSNLRLGSDSQIKLTIDDTDLTSTSVYDSGRDGWYTPVVQVGGAESWSNPVDAKHIFQRASPENSADNITYGNLYNWYTATAGTGLSSMTTNGQEASSSICPKGWKLPPNSGTGSYVDLVTAAGIGSNSAGSTKIRSMPYSFADAGGYYTDPGRNGLNYQGNSGIYWSRTAIDVGTYVFNFYSGYVATQVSGGQKFFGYSIRCYYAG